MPPRYLYTLSLPTLQPTSPTCPHTQITHRISWEEPILPERVEIDDEGGYILTEAGGPWLMPSSRSARLGRGHVWRAWHV